MYIIKNAFKNITRSLGRNALIGIITLVIAVSSCVALSIKQAAKTAETDNLNSLSISATIGVDMQKLQSEAGTDRAALRNMVAQYPAITLTDMQKYAKSQYVKEFIYTLQSSISKGDGIEPYSDTDTTTDSSTDFSSTDNAPNQNANRQGDFSSGFGRMGQQGDFTIIGYSSENAMTTFINGTNTISDGEIFTFDKADNTCIISDTLANYNQLKVGDTITLTNPNLDTETYQLNIKGIYQASSTSTSDDNQMRFSTSQDPANYIYTNFKTLESITSDSTTNAIKSTNSNGNETTTALRIQEKGTYTFFNVQEFESFKTDVTKLGLSEYYIVNSNDVSNYEASLVPIKNLSKFANVFLMLVLLIGGIILIVLNIFNIRERKYEVGVLTAIGMKKWKVAMQFITELFIVTIASIIIGTSIGTIASAPTADTLLDNQIKSSQTQQDNQNQHFGRQGMDFQGGSGMMGQRNNTKVSYIETISPSTDIKVVMELIGIGLILTIISSCASVGFILRYEPLKILSNRN